MDQDPNPSLEDLLGAEPLLEPPEDLVDRILAGLPVERPRPVLHAVARLAAAVVVALGAWIFAFGSAPGLAEAGPAPAVREALGPTLDLVPSAELELPTLAVASSDSSTIAGLAIGGLTILALGLVVAYRLNKESA